jgi:hypothetical protein
MNVFNRVVMILCVILWLAAVALLLLDPLLAVQWARTGLDFFEQAIFDAQVYLYFVIALAVLAFILLVVLWAEVHRARRKSVRIKTSGAGKAQLGINSIVQSLEYRIDELAGVRRVHPRINSHGRDVEVAIDLDTSPSVNVPVLTGQIVDLCRDIVEGQLGVKIRGKVQVNIKHEPYPRGTMPPTGPLGEEAMGAPPMAAGKQATPASTPAQPVAHIQPPVEPVAEPAKDPDADAELPR